MLTRMEASRKVQGMKEKHEGARRNHDPIKGLTTEGSNVLERNIGSAQPI